MHPIRLIVMQHIVFKLCNLPLVFFFFFLLLDMAPKLGGKLKTKAKRNPGSSSSSGLAVGVRFLSEKCEEAYETLNKYRSIWGEREIVLSELDPYIHRTFVARNWVSLCEVFEPLPAALIREFYSNLSVYSTQLLGSVVTNLP